jgi:hypothetical protein
MLATGFPRADVENEFLRARQHQVLASLTHRLRRQPGDSDRLLRLDEVVGALGMRGERHLGLQTIRLDTIVGTAGSRRDFDRNFRPTSNRVRSRWEQLALAERRGAAIPPIEVYRVGALHFVSDGHHRVSIAAATGQQTIDAYVTEVLTSVPPKGAGTPPYRSLVLDPDHHPQERQDRHHPAHSGPGHSQGETTPEGAVHGGQPGGGGAG